MWGQRSQLRLHGECVKWSVLHKLLGLERSVCVFDCSLLCVCICVCERELNGLSVFALTCYMCSNAWAIGSWKVFRGESTGTCVATVTTKETINHINGPLLLRLDLDQIQKKKKTKTEKMIPPIRAQSELSERMQNEVDVGVTGCRFPLCLCLLCNRNLSVEFSRLLKSPAHCYWCIPSHHRKTSTTEPQMWTHQSNPPPTSHLRTFSLHQGDLSSLNGGFEV